MSFTVPDVPGEEVTYVATTTVGALLMTAMAPWVQTNHFAWYLDAIGAMMSPVADLVLDQGVDGDAAFLPGYGQLFNINPQAGQAGFGATVTPAVDYGYLGQFVGVSIPTGTDDVTARSLVLAESGFQRGSVASVIAAAKRNLSGTQSVQVIERTGPNGPSGYFATVIVRPEEVVSLSALTAAINAVKPAGIVITIVQSDDWTWVAATGTWAADTMTWAQTASTQP